MPLQKTERTGRHAADPAMQAGQRHMTCSALAIVLIATQAESLSGKWAIGIFIKNRISGPEVGLVNRPCRPIIQTTIVA